MPRCPFEIIEQDVPESLMEWLLSCVRDAHRLACETANSIEVDGEPLLDPFRKNALPWKRRSVLEQLLFRRQLPSGLDVSRRTVTNNGWTHTRTTSGRVTILQTPGMSIDATIGPTLHRLRLAHRSEQFLFGDPNPFECPQDGLFVALTHCSPSMHSTVPGFVALQVPSVDENGKLKKWPGAIDLMARFPQVCGTSTMPEPEEFIEDDVFPEPNEDEDAAGSAG